MKVTTGHAAFQEPHRSRQLSRPSNGPETATHYTRADSGSGRRETSETGAIPLSDTQTFSALAAGTLTIGSGLVVNLVSYGAMRITGSGVWVPPEAKSGALATLGRTVELDVDLIGAIGMSGSSGEQDPAVAEAGASAR